MKKEMAWVRFLTVLAVLTFLPAGLFARPAADMGAAPSAETAALPPPAAPVQQEQEKIKGYFFYEELCSLCQTDYDRFTSILQEKLPLAERDQYPNTIYILNAHNITGRQEYVRITDDLGLDRGTLEFPLLILGGRVFQGYDSISTNIREAYLTAAEDLYVYQRPYNPRLKKTGANLFDDYPVNPNHVTLVYYYRTTCPYCAQVTPLIDALPKTVLTEAGERPLDIIRINTRSGNNGERIAAFFEAWQVPDEDRVVPIVFFPGSYLSGPEAISGALYQRLGEEAGPWPLLPVQND
jgi:glutaredoxin